MMRLRVVVREGETVKEALRRLKKVMFHASVPYELNWHSYYVSPGEHRRAAKGRAMRIARIAGFQQERAIRTGTV
jgi:ribosomal protein S21